MKAAGIWFEPEECAKRGGQYIIMYMCEFSVLFEWKPLYQAIIRVHRTLLLLVLKAPSNMAKHTKQARPAHLSTCTIISGWVI